MGTQEAVILFLGLLVSRQFTCAKNIAQGRIKGEELFDKLALVEDYGLRA